MKISAFITITNPGKRGDLFEQCLKSAEGFADEVIIIDGKDTWPKEFSWEIIGQHFQNGYEQATGDWVVHLDTDFIFHERSYPAIREACLTTAPAISFLKWQFILPDRYNIKSRLVLAVNKGRYGDRIRFDSGGDLAQPSLDGKYFPPGQAWETNIPFFNYEKPIKNKAQIKDDVERMARAYHRYFGEFKLGTDQTAYKEWVQMMAGRFSKPSRRIPLGAHPKVMQDVISNLSPNQWGYNGFGNLERNSYTIENKGLA